MRFQNQANIEMVKRVAQRLDWLREGVVFVGGAIVDFLITDPAAPPVRSTIDVDVVIEVASRMDYYGLRDPLISRGFREDNTGEQTPICRWDIEGIKVDIMPTTEEILGFSNKWYRDAIRTAVPVEIAEGISIRLITAPCFLITKLIAFVNRGNEDFVASHDLEDAIAVIDGRREIIDEIKLSPFESKRFLVQTFQALLQQEDFVDAIPGHLPDKERSSVVLERIQTIATMDA